MGVATLPQEANMLGRSIVILCLTALFVQLSLGQCTFNDGSCMYDFSSLTVAPENFYSASTNASSPTADVFAFNICGTVIQLVVEMILVFVKQPILVLLLRTLLEFCQPCNFLHSLVHKKIAQEQS